MTRCVVNSSNVGAGSRDLDRAELLLQALADIDCRSGIDANDVAIVIAHPDDETIGCGASLSRLQGASLVVVTDGAPRNGADAARAGFASPADYAAARARELRAALATAAVDESRIFSFGVADQGVCRALAPIARRLASFFESRGVSVVLTHAFEGGHPDHDGVAFCVAAARRLLGARAPATIEMPFYHLAGDGVSMATQRFCDGEDDVIVELPTLQRKLKAAMMSAHATQAETLARFDHDAERFRRAAPHDFHSLPNNGRIFYSTFDCGFVARDWPAVAREAFAALRLERAPRRWFSFA